jgi:hypothetical protein
MSKEYDFRFPGLAPSSLKEKENTLRVKAVRSAILRIADGFTEIPPGACTDMIPGEGMGYIVSLDTEEKSLELEKALQRLAKGWGVTVPVVREAANGPRREFSFILIPELANPDPGGFRRPLFRESRWAQIEETLGCGKPPRVELVYGEWRPSKPNKPIKDASRMFVVAEASGTIRRRLERIIRADVFDGGIECDQICIYLSYGGESIYVSER